MAFGPQPVVDGATVFGAGVAADVVCEEVVREQQVAGPPVHLLWLWQGDGWVGHGVDECIRSDSAEVGGGGPVGAGPDPQVSPVVGGLVGEQDAGQQREGAGAAVGL